MNRQVNLVYSYSTTYENQRSFCLSRLSGMQSAKIESDTMETGNNSGNVASFIDVSPRKYRQAESYFTPGL